MPRPPDQDDDARKRDLADIMRIYQRAVRSPDKSKKQVELANLLWRAASILAGHSYGTGPTPAAGMRAVRR